MSNVPTPTPLTIALARNKNNKNADKNLQNTQGGLTMDGSRGCAAAPTWRLGALVA